MNGLLMLKFNNELFFIELCEKKSEEVYKLKIFSVNTENFRTQSIAGFFFILFVNTNKYWKFLFLIPFYFYSIAIKNQLIGGQNSEMNPSVSTMDNEHIPHRELRQMQTQVMDRKSSFVYHSHQ